MLASIFWGVPPPRRVLGFREASKYAFERVDGGSQSVNNCCPL